MKTLTVIRHVAHERLGYWESIFMSNGYKISYKSAGVDDLRQLDLKSIDLLCILGGPLNAYQDKEHSFLLDEVTLLKQRFDLGLPTLGICLGSQLMARALGERVYPADTLEIGWSPLILSEKGKQLCVKYLGGLYTSMFHWHHDTFDLPSGAELLASTELCKNQIFAIGHSILAFQCHPEVTRWCLEKWMQQGVLMLQGQSLKKFQQDTVQFSYDLKKQSQKCICDWLNSL